MKIYIEESGGGDGNVWYEVYTSPQKTGHAYQYDGFGKKHLFAWVHPKEARVFEEKDLPQEFVYSFKHGTNHVEVPYEKKDCWTIEDLIYEHIPRDKVRKEKQAVKALDKCRTIDDVYNVWSKYKDYFTTIFMYKAMDIINMQPTKIINGELGIACLSDIFYFQIFMKEYGESKKG